MRISKRRRRWYAQFAAASSQLAALRGVPAPVARFYLRGLASAVVHGDQWTIDVATRPKDLAVLLREATGRSLVVEIGTASGWTAAALALASPTSTVVTVDVVRHTRRDRYLNMLDERTRARIVPLLARGEEGPAVLPTGLAGEEVGFLFIDGSHERADTVNVFRAWEPALGERAVVAFHDYGDPSYPGVAEAVAELGLAGSVRQRVFLAEMPATG